MSGRPTSDRARRPLRSTGPPPFYRLVYRLVRRVPRGRVVTYGQVAAILGQPRGARAVGMALAAPRGRLLDLVPWRRLTNSAGPCSPRDGSWAEPQRAFLGGAGVRVD